MLAALVVHDSSRVNKCANVRPRTRSLLLVCVCVFFGRTPGSHSLLCQATTAATTVSREIALHYIWSLDLEWQLPLEAQPSMAANKTNDPPASRQPQPRFGLWQ